MKQISRPKKVSKAKTVPTMTLGFYKKRTCWYAEVPQFDEGHNLMVNGADTFLQVLAGEKGKRVVLEFTMLQQEDSTIKPLAVCTMIDHTRYGATYAVESDIKGMPATLWLCQVCEAVTGEHPQHFYVLKASVEE